MGDEPLSTSSMIASREPRASRMASPTSPMVTFTRGSSRGAFACLGERPTVPLDDLGEQLDELDLAARGQQVEGGAQGEADAEPADHDAGRLGVGQLLARAAGELLLGVMLTRTHQPGRLDDDLVVAVVLDQLEDGSVGRGGSAIRLRGFIGLELVAAGRRARRTVHLVAGETPSPRLRRFLFGGRCARRAPSPPLPRRHGLPHLHHPALGQPLCSS